MHLRKATRIVREVCDRYGYFYLHHLLGFWPSDDLDMDAVHTVLDAGYVCYKNGRLYRRLLKHPHARVAKYCKAAGVSYLFDALVIALERGHHSAANALRAALSDGCQWLDSLIED